MSGTSGTGTSGGTGGGTGGGVAKSDGIVWGTNNSDVMLPGYTDADGDQIDGNDAILPGEFGDDDIIVALGGDDTVDAGAGNDEVYGGAGNDTIDGGAGDDIIYGDSDYGSSGTHGGGTSGGGTSGGGTHGGGTHGGGTHGGGTHGGGTHGGGTHGGGTHGGGTHGGGTTAAGDDFIHGGDGNDTIYGEGGNDTIFGDEGNDVIDAGIDDDTVYGGTGNDTITGGEGEDTLSGGDDRDTFLGGNGGDHVDGGSGGDDHDTLDLTGSGVDFVTYTSADHEDGIVTFDDGSTMDFEEIENVIPCFTPGTLIATPKGEVPVEGLREGDKIITRDNGIQEIRWKGEKRLTGRELVSAQHLRPILISAGALGNGLPERDMLVSPNHRVLVANDRTALYFEEHEVLVAAKHLVNNRGVFALDTVGTTYIHFMFDQHEVVLSNGAWSESFQPGDYTLKGMGNAQRGEIFELFPELQTEKGVEDYAAARKTLKRHEAQLLSL